MTDAPKPQTNIEPAAEIAALKEAVELLIDLEERRNPGFKSSVLSTYDEALGVISSRRAPSQIASQMRTAFRSLFERGSILESTPDSRSKWRRLLRL